MHRHSPPSRTPRAHRAARKKHGREYFFAPSKSLMPWWRATVSLNGPMHVRYGNRARHSRKAIEERIDVVLEIDYQGALQIKKAFANAVLIFILPSWEELRSRLERRGRRCAEDHRERLKNAAQRWPRPKIRLRYNQRVL